MQAVSRVENGTAHWNPLISVIPGPGEFAWIKESLIAYDGPAGFT
jgi:hypothetical protein